MTSNENPQAYWDDRASKPDWQAGSNDPIMARLEVEALAKHLGTDKKDVLEVGCGNGWTIRRLQQLLPACRLRFIRRLRQLLPACGSRFTGIDISDATIKAAKESCPDAVFHVSDVRCFDLHQKFDAVYSVRCLINLDLDGKRDAVDRIAAHLRPGGTYYMLEPFECGLRKINTLRLQEGLPEIRQPWHNEYIEDNFNFQSFNVFAVMHFASTYYLASRLFNAIVNGDKAKYDDPINVAASKLPAFGEFAPHRLVILRRK